MMRAGSLVIDDACRVLMVVETYPGMYGRAMVNAVRAERDMGSDGQWLPLVIDATERAWMMPIAYFADELSAITETTTRRNDR